MSADFAILIEHQTLQFITLQIRLIFKKEVVIMPLILSLSSKISYLSRVILLVILETFNFSRNEYFGFFPLFLASFNFSQKYLFIICRTARTARVTDTEKHCEKE